MAAILEISLLSLASRCCVWKIPSWKRICFSWDLSICGFYLGYMTLWITIMENFSLLFFITFCLSTKASEHLALNGPDYEVFAYLGKEAILNCSVDSLSPIESLEEVTWKRTDQDILVLLYQDGEVQPDSTHETYQGRAEFFTTDILKGIFSLRLKDFRNEDIGEYICEVHTSNWSDRRTVILEVKGFSSIQTMVLVLCFVALLFSFGPFVQLCKKKGTKTEISKLQMVMVICQSISISVAFILWGTTDGFLDETVACAVVNATRFLFLLKVAKVSEKMHLFRVIQDFAIPVQYSVITMILALGSFGQTVFTENPSHYKTHLEFTARILVTGGFLGGVCVFCSIIISVGVVLSLLQNSKKSNSEQFLLPHDFLLHFTGINNTFMCALFMKGNLTSENIFLVMSVLVMGIIFTLTVQRYSADNRNFICSVLALSSALVVMIIMCNFISYILISALVGPEVALMLLIGPLILATAWVALNLVARYCKQRCLKWRACSYIFCGILTSVLIVLHGSACIYYIGSLLGIHGVGGGRISVTAFIHTLAVIHLFKRPRNLPGIPHVFLCVFESFGLASINAITLAAVAFQKYRTGKRLVDDLRTVLMPLECVFVAMWIAFQIHHSWKRTKLRIKNNFKDPNIQESQDERTIPLESHTRESDQDTVNL